MLDRNPAFAGTGVDQVDHDSTQRGFTLTEMLATLAIAAVTATMAVPMMNRIVTDNRHATETNVLISTIHAARSEAILRNEQVTICTSNDAEQCTDSAWHEGWIFFVDSDHDRHIDAHDKILGSANGISQTTILTEDFERFLVFRPNGRLMVETTAENSGEMLLCDHRGAEHNRSIVMLVGGKPQLTVDERPGAYADCRST